MSTLLEIVMGYLLCLISKMGIIHLVMKFAEWDSVSNLDELRSKITKSGMELFVHGEPETSGVNRFRFDVFAQFIDDKSQEEITNLVKSICSDFYGL